MEREQHLDRKRKKRRSERVKKREGGCRGVTIKVLNNIIYCNSNHLTTPALNPNNSDVNDYVDSI